MQNNALLAVTMLSSWVKNTVVAV